MTHERKDIRDAVKAALIGAVTVGPVTTYATSAGLRVFTSQVAPVRSSDLPAVLIYNAEESVDPASLNRSPRELKRTLIVSIEALVKTSEDLDDDLDAAALEIETAMDADIYLDGAAVSSILTGTDFGTRVNGQLTMGAVILTYSVVYRTDLRVAADLPVLEKIGIEYNLNGAQATADTADDLLEIDP